MTEAKRELPSSGYSLLKLYTTRLELIHAEATTAGSQAPLNFGFDWRKVADDHFDVMLRFKIDPSGERPERLVVHLVGHFKQTGEPSVSMEQFANMHAVAILFPYARQHMTALTASSFFGAYYLPMINVGALMKGQNVAASEKPLIETTKTLAPRRRRSPLAAMAAKKR